MELKTIREFAHKGNLGSGLTYENGVFKATVNLNGYLHKNNLGEGLVFSNNKVNVDLNDEFNTIATSLNQLNTKVTQINEQLGTVYKVKGSTTVDNINSMTVGNAMIGYVYNLLDSGVITNGIDGELNVVKGSNIVYTEQGWDEFAVSLDLDLDQCAGDNISIENNVVSALGYKYDKEKESFSIGVNTTASEYSSYAEGNMTGATGYASHAEGSGTIASGDYAHAEGLSTITTHEAEHAEGKYNVSNTTDWIGNTIHSIGIGTSDEDRKNALEVTTQGAVYITEVGGYDGTTLAGCYPIQTVINVLLDSKNNDIPAINQKIDNLNIPTLPENIVSTVNGKTGDVTIDTSEFATKEEVQAVNTRIDGLNIPSDLSNVVTKTDDHQLTLGTDNNSTHEKTLLVGTGLTTSNNESLVVGAYNNAEYFSTLGVDAPAIQVGAGTEDSKRTVMVVQKNGKSLGLLGFEQNGFGDFAEYFEWADGNPEGEDRVGYMVQLNKDKIELAESLDNCIGIITGTGAFVADAACLDWHGRYLKDKWGRNIYALTGVLAENPEYDPTKEYIPREYRKEWSPVGLVGKILVRQDGTLKPNGFVGCVNGIATNVDKSSWRVLKVIDEEIALVLIK